MLQVISAEQVEPNNIHHAVSWLSTARLIQQITEELYAAGNSEGFSEAELIHWVEEHQLSWCGVSHAHRIHNTADSPVIQAGWSLHQNTVTIQL